MVERVTRDLDRERAATRTLRRELDALRSESAEQRRAGSASTANGTLAMDDARAAPRRGRRVRTPEGTRRRVDAARAGAAAPRPAGPAVAGRLWAVRIVAALLVAVLAVALVVLVSAGRLTR